MADDILVQNAAGQFQVLAATDDGDGVLTVTTTTAAATDAILVQQPDGSYVKVAAVRAGEAIVIKTI